MNDEALDKIKKKLISVGLVDANLHNIFTSKCQCLVDKVDNSVILFNINLNQTTRFNLDTELDKALEHIDELARESKDYLLSGKVTSMSLHLSVLSYREKLINLLSFDMDPKFKNTLRLHFPEEITGAYLDRIPFIAVERYNSLINQGEK